MVKVVVINKIINKIICKSQKIMDNKVFLKLVKKTHPFLIVHKIRSQDLSKI